MALAYQLLQHSGTYALEAVASVVGTQIQVADLAHFLFHDQDVFGTGADDDIALYAMLMQPFCLRVYRSGTYAACNEDNLLLLYFF